MLAHRFALEQFHVSIYHQTHQFVESRLRFPAQDLFRFAGVTDKNVHFGWTFVAQVMFDELLPVEINMPESSFAKLAYRMRLVSCKHKIVAAVPLYHLPHSCHILRR